MKKVLSISLVLIMALAVFTGCKRDITVKTDEGNTKISAGSSVTWPKDKMGDLPEPKGGKILSVIDTPQGTSVTVNEISRADYDAYVAKLKALGYKSAYQMDMEGSVVFGAEKEGSTVSTQFHAGEGEGKGSCIVVYMEEMDEE